MKNFKYCLVSIIFIFVFIFVPSLFYWIFWGKSNTNFIQGIVYQNSSSNSVVDDKKIEDGIVKGTVKKKVVKKTYPKVTKKIVKKVKKVKVTKPVKKAKVSDPEDVDNYKVCGTPDDGITIKEAIKKYKEKNSKISLGIDVSAHQKNIDFNKVKKSGVDFVIIRAGFTGWGTGAMKKDAYFETNISKAKAAGLKVGAYYYSVAITEEEAALEAQLTIDIIKSSGYGLDYPVALDYEEINKHRAKGLTDEQRTNIALTYMSYIEQHSGFRTMFYTSKNAYYNSFITEQLYGYKFWLANFIHKSNTTTNYDGVAYIWQYASDGNVPGISTCVDMNIAYQPV